MKYASESVGLVVNLSGSSKLVGTYMLVNYVATNNSYVYPHLVSRESQHPTNTTLHFSPAIGVIILDLSRLRVFLRRGVST